MRKVRSEDFLSTRVSATSLEASIAKCGTKMGNRSSSVKFSSFIVFLLSSPCCHSVRHTTYRTEKGFGATVGWVLVEVSSRDDIWLCGAMKPQPDQLIFYVPCSADSTSISPHHPSMMSINDVQQVIRGTTPLGIQGFAYRFAHAVCSSSASERRQRWRICSSR